jgi:hypothetical protein
MEDFANLIKDYGLDSKKFIFYRLNGLWNCIHLDTNIWIQESSQGLFIRYFY